MAAIIDQNVLGLDVAMQQAAVVGVVQGLGDRGVVGRPEP